MSALHNISDRFNEPADLRILLRHFSGAIEVVCSITIVLYVLNSVQSLRLFNASSGHTIQI